ncbi:MAG: CBS domain-containing protein [Actinomycetota bacterium]
MLVRDLMVPTVLTASPNDTVADVDRAMRENGDAAAVVTDGEQVIGLFTEKELAQASNSATVTEAMRPAATIEPGATLAEAARVMGAKGQRFMPVVDGGMLVGILSLTDIRRWARSEGEGEKGDVQRILKLEVRGYESQSPRT